MEEISITRQDTTIVSIHLHYSNLDPFQIREIQDLDNFLETKGIEKCDLYINAGFRPPARK